MPSTYQGSARREYTLSTRRCLYSPHYNDTGYFCDKTGMWHRCRSCYCNIHGLRNRQMKSRAVEQRLAGYAVYHCLTLHYGQEATQAQRSRAYTNFTGYIRHHFPKADFVRITHWKPSRANPRAMIPHHHVPVAHDEPISRRRLRGFFVRACQRAGIQQPAIVRLGYRRDQVASGYLVYCFRIGKFKNKLVLPPPGVRWEMCRLSRR
jgi:hypothetical protein